MDVGVYSVGMFRLFGNTQVPPLFGKFDTVSCHRLWSVASLCITFSPLAQGLRNQSEAALGVFDGLWSLLRHDSCLSCQCIESVMPHETFPRGGIGSCVKENNYHDKKGLSHLAGFASSPWKPGLQPPLLSCLNLTAQPNSPPLKGCRLGLSKWPWNLLDCFES